MGWLFAPSDAQSIREYFTRERFERLYNSSDGKAKVIDFSLRGHVAYLAYQYPDEDLGADRVTCIVCLLERQYDRGSYHYGHKTMDEAMGPYCYDCPKRILDKLTEPPPPGYAQQWREKCRARASRKRAKPGDVIRFDTMMTFTDGAQLDTFRVVNRDGKTLFTPTDNAYVGLYQIPGWTKKDYQVISTA